MSTKIYKYTDIHGGTDCGDKRLDTTPMPFINELVI